MTNEDAQPGPLRRGLRTGRLEAFSDGVFAIAVTLLVLDIAVPASAEAHLLRLTPGLAGYVVLIIAGIFIPVVAVIGYLGVALYYVIPFPGSGPIWFGRQRRRPRRSRDSPGSMNRNISGIAGPDRR